MTKILLKNGTLVSGSTVQKTDILIHGEKIAQVSQNISCQDAQIIDMTGKFVFPGFIDGHTHMDLEVAGTVTADNFEWGTKAAAAGGTTMIVDFATQYKGQTLKQGLANWHKKADGQCSCDYGFHMSIADWNEEVRAEIPGMIQAGVTSFKLYMTYPDMLLHDGEIYEVIKELKKYGCFAGVHCENADVIDSLIKEAKENGRLGPRMHPKVRPDTMEAEAVHRLLVIAEEANAPVMVVHLTNQKAYEEIQNARAKGQKVYAETCPQYLLLDDSVYEKPDFQGADYVCAPPIRKKADQECLWKALAEESIQTVATDQCSFTREQKKLGQEDFTKIPGGLPGVQVRGELVYTYGVAAGKLTLSDMCRVLSENPAKLYGIYPQKGALLPGSDADIAVIDPEKKGTICAEKQLSRAGYSPFEGFALEGRVTQVYLRGELVAENGKIVKEKTGKYIFRGKNSLEDPFCKTFQPSKLTCDR